jgi:hypothetical protein
LGRAGADATPTPTPATQKEVHKKIVDNDRDLFRNPIMKIKEQAEPQVPKPTEQ